MNASGGPVVVELAADGLPAVLGTAGRDRVWPPLGGVAAAVESAFREAHRARTNRSVPPSTLGSARPRAPLADDHRRPPQLDAGACLDRLEAAYRQATRRTQVTGTGRSADGRVQLTVRPLPALGLWCVVDEQWASQVGPARVEDALRQALAAARAALPPASVTDSETVPAVLAEAMAVLRMPGVGRGRG